MVADRLDDLGAEYRWFNQRHARHYSLECEVVAGEVRGELRLGEELHRLEEIEGVYTRLMDDRLLPELAGEPEDSLARRRCRALHNAFFNWYEVAPARVVNRGAPQGSNSSKPYQAQLIRDQGFWLPETLITNDPQLVHTFRRQHGEIIFKSISGTRSIVRCLTDEDLHRLEDIRWCPVQFQAFVPGTNVRVHTVGTEAFVTEVETNVTDYRYVHHPSEQTTLHATRLPDEIIEACLRLAGNLGLPFAGIDLKLTSDGRVYCFEVNPSPAYSFFEAHTGQPIALALARYLVGIST
jgi:glutathione synthase/RimK-type ligase-like ATP-grasp enzyme